jgi:hypothetical protein
MDEHGGKKKKKISFSKLSDVVLGTANVNCDMAKNEIEYLQTKRKKKIRRAVFFVIFCCVVLTVYVLAFVAVALYDGGMFESGKNVAEFAKVGILNNDGHPALYGVVV